MLYQKAIKSTLQILVATYRSTAALWVGGACRYYPSCSEYAEECLKRHPPIEAGKLIVKRLIKCRPGSDFGYDPVP